MPLRMQNFPEHPLSRATELLIALTAFIGALFLNTLAGRVADEAGVHAHSSPDLLFQYLPIVDMRFFFLWGFLGFVCWATFAALKWERERLAYILWLFALLIVVRCFFIVLTPMKLHESALSIDGDPLYETIGKHFTLRHDLFFSSHTAMPFLASLIFRGRWIRLSFLGISILMASSVLLSRLHYSIDVFAAYFITYATYHAENRWFQVPYMNWRRRWVATPVKPQPAPDQQT
ncbi:MAG: hypothetical protein HYT79_01030 [Elusimicrobia bacterium]|nr:hypothetical protein [Elusimicrobiota bacterium]